MHHYDSFEPRQVSTRHRDRGAAPQDALASVEDLLASREDIGRWPIDRDAYAAAARDWCRPILLAGRLDAPLCVLGRDLGREEVLLGEPLVGAAGRRLRRALHSCLLGTEPDKEDRYVRRVLSHVLLANIVPYKPVGNSPFAREVREAVRPAVEFLLACAWKGRVILTLGAEAFHWFEPYCPPGTVRQFWSRADRFQALLECSLAAHCAGVQKVKPVTIAPLPHPSPLNRRFYEEFEHLLAARWEQAKGMAASLAELEWADAL